MDTFLKHCEQSKKEAEDAMLAYERAITPGENKAADKYFVMNQTYIMVYLMKELGEALRREISKKGEK